MTKFERCPNCGRRSGGFVLAQFYVYECSDCGKLHCTHSGCGETRCPRCGSKRRKIAGYVKN